MRQPPSATTAASRASIVSRKTRTTFGAREGGLAFPERVFDNVFFCGFTSESSFGAWSYLIRRPATIGGNVLVDSPRFTAPLVKQIEAMGGIRLMYLTHRDDIADHAKFAAHFKCSRVMHQAEGAERWRIERILDGEEPRPIDQDLLSIATPGHTRGHQVLLYKNEALLTGDHLAWSPRRSALIAFRDACWYSWSEQTRSMERLLDYRFEWVLPGHGRIHHLPAPEMHAELLKCVQSMRRA